MVRTGSSGYLQYGKEATFAGGAVRTRVFGLFQKITGVTWKNNQIPIPALNDIEVKCFAYGKNEGSGSVEFVMSSPWIFDIMLDGVLTSGSGGDFTHKWGSAKGFGEAPINLTSVSIHATAPVVTTSGAHGYSNGDTIAITGSDAVPSVNGNWVISAASGSVFSISTTTTGAGTAVGTANKVLNATIATPHTMHIEHGLDAETNNVVRNMKGVVMNSLTLKATLNETVKATAELAWGNEDAVTTTLDGSPAADDIKFPYTFAHASLELPGATTVAQIQEFELTFNLNSELLYGIGSANAVSAFRKIFDMTGKFKAATVDKTQLQRIFDAADGTTANTGIATLKVTLTNGLTTTNEKAIILDFTGVGTSEHQTQMEPGEPVFEDLVWQLRNVTVTANNGIATPA